MVQELHARCFNPTVGQVYHNMGGSDYVCLESRDCMARMMNVYSGWELIAIGMVQYENGWIEWDWSKGLSFNNDLLDAWKKEGVVR